jgi:hypothetical protein
LLARDAGQNDSEFVAADAADYIGLSEPLFQQVRQSLDYLVANHVAMGVIYGFETVDIQNRV